MKSALILLVVSIFATPKESFAEPKLRLSKFLTETVDGVGVTKRDKSAIFRAKADCKSNISRCTTDVFKWIDDQCVKQKCEWTIPKTHIASCKSAVRDMQNCIDTQDAKMGPQMKIIVKRFENGCQGFKESIPKQSGKNKACYDLMCKIYAMLSKMQSDCRRETDQCSRNIMTMHEKLKGLLP